MNESSDPDPYNAEQSDQLEEGEILSDSDQRNIAVNNAAQYLRVGGSEGKSKLLSVSW
jgi:hypothetical protein